MRTEQTSRRIVDGSIQPHQTIRVTQSRLPVVAAEGGSGEGSFSTRQSSSGLEVWK
jgi:hypothetical protein